MKLNKIWVLLTIVFFSKPVYAQEKLNVVVSILPQAYFAEQIGKDQVDVSVMIPPGGNPHTYEPTPSQLTKLSRADLYIKVGSGVEFENQWMDKLIALNKKMEICDSSRGVKLIAMAEQDDHEEADDHQQEHAHHADHQDEEEHKEKHGHYDDHEEEQGHHEEYAKHDAHGHEHLHHHGGKDPHIWLSPNNAIIMATNMKEALIKIDPANKEYYQQNTNELITELDDLKKEIDAQLNSLPYRTFLIFHPAWGYFAADFNLIQVAVEYCGKEPTPKQMAKLIKAAKDVNAKVIYASPQFSQSSADAIASEIKGRVVLIDPLGKDYVNNLRKAAQALLESYQ
jgi:zinc transport system substrate-binding protein